MKIGFNLTFLVPGKTGGMEVYARRLIPALAELHPEWKFVLFASPELYEELRVEPWVPNMTVVRIPVSGNSRVRRILAEQLLLPFAVRRAKVDLLHSLASTAPAFLGVKSVVTIHDLIYATHPETHPGLLRYGMALLVPLAARRSDHIVAISQWTKDELTTRIKVDSEKITVVHHGADEPTPIPASLEKLRAKYDLGEEPLILSVSARRPHKNLDRLIDAVCTLAQGTLILPGYPSPHDDVLRARGGDRVRVLGWVSDEDLEGLYAAVRCVVVPSLAEGFGLPALEALRRGVPLACSNATSLPEVVGDAALLFDPQDKRSIGLALAELLTDKEGTRDLIVSGKIQASKFTWHSAAERTCSIYKEHVLDSGTAARQRNTGSLCKILVNRLFLHVLCQ